ncbi:hypothetical protein BJX65DRAFT_321640 [Aspergillus insuetus]
MPLGLNYNAELWHLSQQLYPDLPAIEAYLALHRDYVAPLVGPAINGTLTVLEIVLLFKGHASKVTYVQAACLCKENAEQLYSYVNNLIANSGSAVSSLTAGEKEVLAQLTAEIWQRYQTGTLGQPSAFTANGIKTAAAGGAGVSGQSATTMSNDITDKTTSTASASSGPAESFFDRINYLECWKVTLQIIQTAQAQQMIKALNVIADHLGDSNCIAVMGAGGPDGFARPIYDLIKLKISKIDPADQANHRFFIYHDSTNWHPAFERLTSQNPLPVEFIDNPCDDLDHSCLFMRDVKLNLPAAPVGLLHGVSNVLDADHWNKIAGNVGAAITAPAYGWGVNGACLAVSLGVGTLTGLGPLLAIPMWVGIAPFAMGKTSPIIEGTIYDALCEEDPRVLGSKKRLCRLQRRS